MAEQHTLKHLKWPEGGQDLECIVEVAKRDILGRQIDLTYLTNANFTWSGLTGKPFDLVSSDWFETTTDANDNVVLQIKESYLNSKYVTVGTYNTLVNTTLPATYVAISGFKTNYLDANNVAYSGDNISIFNNNAGYITNAVDNLTNYYKKTETYTQAEVNNLIAQLNSFEYVVTDTLPIASADTMYKIYLIPAGNPETTNIKDEFITVRSGSEGSYTYSWEQIGSTAVDLSSYIRSDATISANYIPVGDDGGRKVKTSDLKVIVNNSVDNFQSNTNSLNIKSALHLYLTPGSGGDLIINSSTTRPYVNNAFSLGTSSYKFKNLFLSGQIKDGNNANYGLILPDTTSWTASRTIATTNDIPPIIAVTETITY